MSRSLKHRRGAEAIRERRTWFRPHVRFRADLPLSLEIIERWEAPLTTGEWLAQKLGTTEAWH